jgi:outer membrane lipoprotein-sorting protein
MSSQRQRLAFFIVWFAILGWITSIGQAASALAPNDLLKQVQQRFDTLKDYQCIFVTTGYKNGKVKEETNNYFFKKPQLIRLEVTSGKDKGAVAIYNRQGKVRAHAGGLLGVFKITMEPNDKRLLDSEGNSFVDSHLGGAIRDMSKLLATASNASITEIDRQGRCYLLQVERPNKKDLIIVNTQQLLPIEWQSYKDGQPTSKTEWRSLRVDQGLADSLFEM